MGLNSVKVIIFCIAIFSLNFNIFASSKQSSQIIQSGHWIYDDLTILSTENQSTMYLENQPLSVGEIRFFLDMIDYSKLSDSGKLVYYKVNKFLNEDHNFIKDDSVRMSFNLKLNPEFYYKSNKEIPFTFKTNFKDYAVTFPIIIGFSDFITIESDIFVGVSPVALKRDMHFTNIPSDGRYINFYTPDFAYFSGIKMFDNWGIAAHMGKEGMRIGNTSLESLIYSSNFNTDFYMQLNLFNKYLKYSMFVNEVSNSQFLYMHQITFRPFRNFNMGVLEGSLLNSSFEIRYLNPLMIMHSFGSWAEYNKEQNSFYGESNFCAYLAFSAEFIPFSNFRIYALFAQNEILDLGGSRSPKALSVPDSIGAQAGAEYFIPLKNKGYVKTCIETVYTSPYLYVKHSPDWSLYREKRDMQSGSIIRSWLGSPFGPDCFALQLKASYDTNDKWSAGFGYIFSIHGENTADKLFDSKFKDENGFWHYYPSIEFKEANDDADKQNAAVKKSRNMWMTGIKEYKHQLSINGHYAILENVDLSGQLVYTFVFNNKNKLDSFEQGIELSFAATYMLFE